MTFHLSYTDRSDVANYRKLHRKRQVSYDIFEQETRSFYSGHYGVQFDNKNISYCLISIEMDMTS